MGAFPLGSHGSYPRTYFPVPVAVQKAAAQGLELRAEYGRGGTAVGIARAKQLSRGVRVVTLRDLVYIRSYFRRHARDRLDLRDPPSNGWVAWQLWGGYAAQRWAERYVEQYRRGLEKKRAARR